MSLEYELDYVQKLEEGKTATLALFSLAELAVMAKAMESAMRTLPPGSRWREVHGRVLALVKKAIEAKSQ